jgi:hypothetical protein
VSTLLRLEQSTLQVLIHPSNSGKTSQVLRIPTIKHTFVNHGESDKLSSCNPYAKAYDEVWVAGPAARERYAAAEVGVEDKDVVEIGRPQLDAVRPYEGPPTGTYTTVLYAPTWEGWDGDPGNTSLVLAGENIVKKLIKADPPVRVLYKPHPFTGTVSAAAGAAHRRITALVEKAALERTTDSRFTADTAEQDTAKADLVRIEARIAELSGTVGEKGDEAEATRDGVVDVERHAEVARLRAEWNDAYWRSFGSFEHRVVTGAEPRLYDCFNVSDAMVSDISSVVSDFIASGKPYAVADSAGLGVEEFKRQNTAVRAAVILSNKATELGELLAAVRAPAADKLAADRKELKQYLLGPDEPTSIEQFNTAVADLARKAGTRNLGQESRNAAGVPGADELSDALSTPQPPTV